jgi:hypothetical protein
LFDVGVFQKIFPKNFGGGRMPKFIQKGHSVSKKPVVHELNFEKMFTEEGNFLDHIPLDELQKHMRKTKSYHKIKKKT